MNSPSYFAHHCFFCLNHREEGRPSCARHGGERLYEYAKERIKALGLNGRGQVRINRAGCLDRCEEGPVIVVYPEEVWYTYLDESDIDEIIEAHLIGGKPVDRLRLE